MLSNTNVDDISRLYAEEHVGMVKLAHLMTGSLFTPESLALWERTPLNLSLKSEAGTDLRILA